MVSGSTRLKAGTATKMVLNMLSTGAMIRLGKTYGNLMVDLRASNTKLADRARRIVRAVTNLSEHDSERLLRDCGGEVKTAIVSHYTGFSSAEARQLLSASHGHLRKALEGHSANNAAVALMSMAPDRDAAKSNPESSQPRFSCWPSIRAARKPPPGWSIRPPRTHSVS